MRVLLLAVLIGCGGARGAATPAWPKLHEAEHDGGEGLAPRQADEIATAIEKSDDDEPATEDVPAAAAPAEAEPDAPAATPTAAPATPDDAVMGDDITIEVEE